MTATFQWISEISHPLNDAICWHRTWSSLSSGKSGRRFQWKCLRYQQDFTVRHAWPGSLGHVNFVLGHVKSCGNVLDWASDFWGRAWNYFPSTTGITFTGLVHILAGHVKIFAGHIKFSELHAWWACKPNKMSTPARFQSLEYFAKLHI